MAVPGPLGVAAQTWTVSWVCLVLVTLGRTVDGQDVNSPGSLQGLPPSKPLNLTVIPASCTSMKLSWVRPEEGAVEGYRIYLLHDNRTDSPSPSLADPATQSPVEYEVQGLQPNTSYKVWVKAYSSHNQEGDPSEALENRTDVCRPSAPQITIASCEPNNSLFLGWSRPVNFTTIDYYYISYRSEKHWTFDEMRLEGETANLDTNVTLPNLLNGTMYEVKVRGASKSVIDEFKVIQGDESEPRKVLVSPNCDTMTMVMHSNAHEHGNFGAGIIVGLVTIIVALCLATAACVIWKKCFHASYYYLDDPPRAPPPTLIDWDAQTEESGMKTSVPVDMFAKHVAELHADSDIGFSKEYDEIQLSRLQEDFSTEISQSEDNKAKNRYLNILAYDHSRVQLLPIPSQKKSFDYINANYIDGYHRAQAFIGTQGPLPTTFECFWRMIWEQRVAVIVMITNLVERGRRKCDMYWPGEGTETYGMITCKVIKEDIMATYTVRTMIIRHLKVKKKKHNSAERIVYQYHYTNWPDHGTPDHPLPVLNFVKKSSAANPSDAGPIVVHCSAGVGRTGTYIVLDAMLRQIRSKGDVNIAGYLRHIRSQRNFLVQTEEQYIFIHDALLEAIESGETNINQAYMSRYLLSLQASGDGGESGNEKRETLLETQFKSVTSFQPKDFNLVSASKPINQPKNRSQDLVPVENARVHLTPKPGVDGSDYINASWLPGFNKLKEFIITQHPLESTIQDFWQMVWDHNAQTIVTLSNCNLDEGYGPFWPTSDAELDAENYKVKFISESEHVGYQTRDFIVQSLQDDYELPVRIIQCPEWPHNCIPLSSMAELLRIVQEWHLDYQNGPIIVMDRFGGTEAAIFCCLTTLTKQLEYENHADVYMYAKLYHNKHPGIWKSQEDFLLLYRALEAMYGSSNHSSAASAAGSGSGVPAGSVGSTVASVPGSGAASPVTPATETHITVTDNHIISSNCQANGYVMGNGNGTASLIAQEEPEPESDVDKDNIRGPSQQSHLSAFCTILMHCFY
ncbi:hypothetical protein FOCC_FOCC013819 [Frankliniella occidentalis]|nr:hypothetical protein FOCC_FOCC013819 [Frankliniella occidentalis]